MGSHGKSRAIFIVPPGKRVCMENCEGGEKEPSLFTASVDPREKIYYNSYAGFTEPDAGPRARKETESESARLAGREFCQTAFCIGRSSLCPCKDPGRRTERKMVKK